MLTLRPLAFCLGKPSMTHNLLHRPLPHISKIYHTLQLGNKCTIHFNWEKCARSKCRNTHASANDDIVHCAVKAVLQDVHFVTFTF